MISKDTREMAIGIVSVVTFIVLISWAKKSKGPEKKSGFVDENQSDASGSMAIPPGVAKKKYKPNSWAKIGNNWIWVNGEGNLIIGD